MNKLYVHSESVHNMAAAREVVPIIMELVSPNSVLDVGCGTGTWLKAFEDLGVKTIIGVDGEYVDETSLVIGPEKFVARDLRTPWSLGRSFDLVVSLEVAEHLPESSAESFVESLVSHATNTIIFSAAIPGQGGQNHLNEQWPEYWQEKFKKHGFYFHDKIRDLFWNNEKVDWWYRQNMFLVTKEPDDRRVSLSRVHPSLWNQIKQAEESQINSILSGHHGMRLSLSILINSIKFKINSILKKV